MATWTANKGELSVGLDKRPGIEPESPFVALLRDLAQELCDEGRVVARLQQGVDPRRYDVILHPRHRPGQKYLMLAMWVGRDRVIVSADLSAPFESPAAFRQWVAAFVAHPVLQANLTELARFAEEPVEAYLRTLGPNVRSRDDGIVEVSAADQERLDCASVNTELDLLVRARLLAGAGALDPVSSYKTLDSAGLTLSVLQRTQTNPGSLTLRVRKAQ
jgi:hypothetical protein